MKTLGIIGGTSYVSTAETYRTINHLFSQRAGGFEFPKMVIYSVNLGEVVRNADADRHDLNEIIMKNAANGLIAAGAEAVMFGANTMHRYIPALTLTVPILHIADAIIPAIRANGQSKVALLGTRLTMEETFIRSRIEDAGIECLTPETQAERDWIQESIFLELARDIFTPETKARYLEIIEGLIARGAQGVILGCTEIPLLLKPEDVRVPTYDTGFLHAEYAVNWLRG
ncbi:MAG: amino acid racemase [Fimbriimonadaceae bacterium]